MLPLILPYNGNIIFISIRAWLLVSQMSPVFSHLKQFITLVVPTLAIGILLWVLYAFKYQWVTTWLTELAWLSYLGLCIAVIIAWKFGRSRLVYACLLLGLFLNHEWLTLPEQRPQLIFQWATLSFIFLFLSKDKGFSPRNALFSLGVLCLCGLFSWLIIPSLQLMIEPKLADFDNVLYQLSPAMREMASPWDWIFLLTAGVIAAIRLFVKIDNTHNALFFGLIAVTLMYITRDQQVNLIVIVCMSCLVCYSVIKDSFTMAFMDELTDIPSRRALMQFVQTLGRKYVVVMSDIDHFKKFNDTYGHDVGDEVLKLVASKLAQVQGGGKTFRFGGEEFVIIFPHKTAEQVAPIVELVRQTIADYGIALRVKPRPTKPNKTQKGLTNKTSKTKIVKVTTSFGIAQRTAENLDFPSIMKQADIALYGAKKAGRNCIQVAKQ
jgi:diguanylate cyclase (GGDEF)-like protein